MLAPGSWMSSIEYLSMELKLLRHPATVRYSNKWLGTVNKLKLKNQTTTGHP